MIKLNNNVIPLTWKELRDGYIYLLTENLTLPDYFINLCYLGNIGDCTENNCYIKKINSLEKFDYNTYKALTIKINKDFISMNICQDHNLPLIQRQVFDNTDNEIAYLMSASSLVKLKKVDFENLIFSRFDSIFENNKENNNFFYKFYNYLRNNTFLKKNFSYKSEKFENYSNADLETISNIKDLQLALRYVIENEVLYNSKRNQSLDLVIREFVNIYNDYKFFYIETTDESELSKDLYKLNSNFNTLARNLFIEIINQLKHKNFLSLNEDAYHKILNNYEINKQIYLADSKSSDIVYVALKYLPNQNSLLSYGFKNSNSIKTYFYLLHNLFPKYEIIFEQISDPYVGKRFIAKLSFDDYLKLYLFFDNILESDIYDETDSSIVKDATVFWSNDISSPYYFFDEAVRVSKIL